MPALNSDDSRGFRVLLRALAVSADTLRHAGRQGGLAAGLLELPDAHELIDRLSGTSPDQRLVEMGSPAFRSASPPPRPRDRAHRAAVAPLPHPHPRSLRVSLFSSTPRARVDLRLPRAPRGTALRLLAERAEPRRAAQRCPCAKHRRCSLRPSNGVAEASCPTRVSAARPAPSPVCRARELHSSIDLSATKLVFKAFVLALIRSPPTRKSLEPCSVR